jgi:hypothetical protein
MVPASDEKAVTMENELAARIRRPSPLIVHGKSGGGTFSGY